MYRPRRVHVLFLAAILVFAAGPSGAPAQLRPQPVAELPGRATLELLLRKLSSNLVRSADPFPFNSGPRTGALVEAEVGQGRWIDIGLGLWRQLPAGTDGAYQLLANLLSLGADR